MNRINRVMVPIISHLDRSLYPFLLVYLLPIVTVPTTLLLLSSLPTGCVIGDSSTWELRYAQVAFLPGVANLLPFLWLMSGTTRVRRSAIVAGLVGAGRFLFPQVMLFFITVSGSSWSCSGSVYVDPYKLFLLVPLMLILWVVMTLLGTGIFLWMNSKLP